MHDDDATVMALGVMMTLRLEAEGWSKLPTFVVGAVCCWW